MAHTRVQTAWDLYDQDESGYVERTRREEEGRGRGERKRGDLSGHGEVCGVLAFTG